MLWKLMRQLYFEKGEVRVEFYHRICIITHLMSEAAALIQISELDREAIISRC